MAVVDLADMIGKKLLVGVTYLGADDLPQHSIEFAGIVTAVGPHFITTWTVKAPSQRG